MTVSPGGLPAAGNAGRPAAGVDNSMGVLYARTPYRTCPLCEGELQALREASCEQHPLWRLGFARSIAWVQCQTCQHVCTAGYFAEEAAHALFARMNIHQQLGHDLERQRWIAARIVDRVAVFGSPPPSKWLDVGFGNGALLFTATEWGYEVLGLELRHANAEALRAVGYEAVCADIAELRAVTGCPAKSFGVISMADVLEHMPFPREGLRAAAELLAPGGTLVVSMPAYDSPMWQYLDGAEANPYWGELEHYHNFSRARLYQLLAEHGFSHFAYGVSERYRACMEVLARRTAA